MSKDALFGFLARHRLSTDHLHPRKLLADLISDMDKGLRGTPSSLAMIPSYVDTDARIEPGVPVAVVDAGGTNLRVAVVEFGNGGYPSISNYESHVMPGVQREAGLEDFFDELADRAAGVAAKSKLLGFCFSYPAETLPNLDARLTTWTKEIKAPQVVGKLVGSNLACALERRGIRVRFAVVNDTIATLMAGKVACPDSSSCVGFILGTGTNAAYVESNSNIVKLQGKVQPGNQAINIESGNFDKTPRGDIDEELDSVTVNPGQYQFEKMISGVYLGRIALLALRKAAAEGLVSNRASAFICSLETVTSADVSSVIDGGFQPPLSEISRLDRPDVGIITAIMRAIVARAALLAAIPISGAIVKSGSGSDPDSPVCVNVDGSTIWKMTGMKDELESRLHEILDGFDLHHRLLRVENSPLIGSAAAALAAIG